METGLTFQTVATALWEASGLSKKEYADKCGISRSHLSKIINDPNANPSNDVITKICAGGGVHTGTVYVLLARAEEFKLASDRMSTALKKLPKKIANRILTEK